MNTFMQIKNTLQIILIRLQLLCCTKLMSNNRAQCSQNLSQTEKFTVNSSQRLLVIFLYL